MSTRRTFLFFFARPAEREILEEVLPTPPFCDAIAIIIFKLNVSESSKVIPIAFLTLTRSTIKKYPTIVNRQNAGRPADVPAQRVCTLFHSYMHTLMSVH